MAHGVFGRNFHARVLAEIESCPSDVLADYARIVELLMEHDRNLKLPYSRAFGDGLFELRPRGRSGVRRAFYCFLIGQRFGQRQAEIERSSNPRSFQLLRRQPESILPGLAPLGEGEAQGSRHEAGWQIYLSQTAVPNNSGCHGFMRVSRGLRGAKFGTHFLTLSPKIVR